MGTCYDQLSDAERKTIGRLHAAGQSKRQIAATLLRDPSTITRELRRNSLGVDARAQCVRRPDAERRQSSELVFRRFGICREHELQHPDGRLAELQHR